MENRLRITTIRRTFFVAFLSVLLMTVQGWAGEVKTGENSDENLLFAMDPDLVTGVLPNGFSYFILRNTTPENRVSLHLNVAAGSMQETDNEQGLAHYLEHMLFNGSTHFKPGELVEYFQSIGMRFGADANAHTSFYETVYDIFLPSGDRDSLDKGLLVLDDYARGALLLESEIKREQGIILAEMRERDSVSYRTFKAILSFEVPGSRIAERLPIGTEDSILAADRKKLKDYYDTWYRPEKMSVVLVGDVDVAMAESLIKERFSDLTPRAPARIIPDDVWPQHQGSKVFYHYEPEAGNTDITIETVTRVPFKADTLDEYKKRVVRHLADTMLGHRLNRLVRTGAAPFSKANVYSGTYLQTLAFSAVTAEVSPQGWKQTLALLEQNLRMALEKGFSKNELDRVKADFISELDSDVREAETRKSTDLARQIIRSNNLNHVFLSPAQDRSLLKPFVEALSLETVEQTFQDTWNQDHRLIMVTGNTRIDAGKTDAENQILESYVQSVNVPVVDYKMDAAKRFPYLPIPPQPGDIESIKEISDLGITVIRFKNNSILNLKQTDYKKGEFIFKIEFGPGRSAEPGSLSGLSYLSEAVMNGSGLGGLDKDELEEALAGRNVQVEFSVDEDVFFFSGSAEPEEGELVFQLVRNYLLDPAFRSSAFKLAKERYKQMVQGLARTPEGMMRLKGERFLAGGDTRFGLPDADAVLGVTLENVKEWLSPYLDSAPFEVSVVGDFDPEQIKKAVALYLGSLPVRGSVNQSHLQDVIKFPSGEKLEVGLDTKLENAIVRVGFPTDDMWDIKKNRRLNILAQMLSERLRKTIREAIGAAYSPYAYNDPSKAYTGYGVLSAVVQVKPEQIAFLSNQIEMLMESMSSKGLADPKELELALEPALTHIKDLRQNNVYWLNSVLSGSWVHPEKFVWAREIETDYAAISLDEISRLASDYLKMDKSAWIVITPLDNETRPIE